MARWRDWQGDGVQHLVVRRGEAGFVADAVVLGDAAGMPFAARFRVATDEAWRTRWVVAGVLGDERRIELTGDGAGRWRDGAGVPLPDIDGALDVDLSLTPFTNTLPIRRLALGRGESADIRVAYVRLPEFTVGVDPQRYTCLEPGRRYRFESLDNAFARDVDVDADGLVVVYPGLFRRVL